MDTIHFPPNTLMATPPSKADANQNRKTPTATATAAATASTTAISASFLKSVCLHDWWLVKAEVDSQGRRLGVGGFSSRERHGVRVFCSAAITKRHDATTLETTDGITITISGFMNRSRTHQNGFPSEICNHFLIGFPYYWEAYAARCFGEESGNRDVPTRISTFDESCMSSINSANSFLPVSLDDLPVTRIRDHLMSSLGDSENCVMTKSIFNDILGKFSGNAFKDTGVLIYSNMESNSSIMTGDSALDETPSKHTKVKVEQKYKHDNGILDATDMRTENFQKSVGQSKMGVDVITPSKGVSTRSMTRLKNNRNKQEASLSCNTSMKHGISDLSSLSEATRKQHGGMVTRRSASNASHAREKKEVKEIADKSAVRRSSSRLKNLKK